MALVRNGLSGSAMDALAYAYTAGTNRLYEVTDASYQYGPGRGATYTYNTYDADGAVTRMDGLSGEANDLDTDLTLDRRKLPVLVSRFDGDAGVTTTVASRLQCQCGALREEDDRVTYEAAAASSLAN